MDVKTDLGREDHPIIVVVRDMPGSPFSGIGVDKFGTGAQDDPPMSISSS